MFGENSRDLIRRGVTLPLGADKAVTELQKKIARFKDMDFKVKPGSILEKDIRDHYVEFEKAYKGGH